LFLGRQAKEAEFKRVGIPCVALKQIILVKDFVKLNPDSLTDAKSDYYEGQPEGVVIKNYARMNMFGRQMFAKVVRSDFKELNRACFGGAKQDRSSTHKLVEYAFTPARIDKRINQLVFEDGQKLERKLMAKLPMAVIADVFKEETPWILRNVDTLHLKLLKQIVSAACLAKLDARIEQVKEEIGHEQGRNS
jgi:hypothetical protein